MFRSLRNTAALSAVALGFGAALAAGLKRAERRRDAPRYPALALLRRAAESAIADRLLSFAAAIAFFALLSLVPALSVLISLYGLLTVPADIPSQLAALDWPVPADLRRIVVEQATRLAATSSDTLSTTLIVSVAVATWSANSAVKAAFDGLDQMWGLAESRSFVRLNLVSLGFTITGVVAIAAMLLAFALAPAFADLFPGSAGTVLVGILRWPILLGAGFAAILLLYRHGPDRAPPALRHQLPGAAFATLGWTAASAGFSWYAATLGSYSATYGSLAGVVVVLTWAWISAILVLAGGEITAEIERTAQR